MRGRSLLVANADATCLMAFVFAASARKLKPCCLAATGTAAAAVFTVGLTLTTA
jgi:hypothetical protein